MTSLSPSPLMVALVQAATMAPMAVLSLPSGALADIFDRRWLLVVAQAWGLVSAVLLFVVTYTGDINVALLLILTLMTACGSALGASAFQAITSDVVPRPLLAQAVNLGGVSNNLARLIAPALAGVLIAAAGAEWVFLANAFSILGVLFVLRGWKGEPAPNRWPTETLLSAIRAGVRYAHSAPEIHSALIRSLAFFLCASALWSLLPLIARQQLGLGPTGYGLILSSIGAGAICGALLLPRISGRMTANGLSKTAALLMAFAVFLIGLADDMLFALLAAILAGIGWSIMSANLKAATQLGAASWVSARAFGVFLMVFQTSMAVGAIGWGALALQIGIPNTLFTAAGLLAAGLIVANRHPLIIDPNRDFSPSGHLPDPLVDHEPAQDEGPVLVTIEYQVDPPHRDEFILRLHKLRAIRLRDGAVRWRYWRDVAEENRVIETFIVDSWLEHMRQHDRFTKADRILHDRVRELHIGELPPLVRHWIAIQ